MIYRQISVAKDNHKQIFWMEDTGKLKVGAWVKPKGFSEWWKIEAVWPYSQYGTEIKRTWHVGGL